MPRYNYALTLAYEVVSDNPDMPTYEECLAALKQRLQQILDDPEEGREALLSEAPFDIYEVEDA